MAKSDYIGFDLYSYFYGLVRQIPEGRVTTYGDLARALGDVRAARACAYMLSITGIPDDVPSHRVVHSDGSVGKYTHLSGTEEKTQRLGKEGIKVRNATIDLENCRISEFKTDYPLSFMLEEQSSLISEFEVSSDISNLRICAVDVSYSDHYGIGSAVFPAGNSLMRKSVRLEVKFPYIPGYLSYREYPFVRELCREFDGIVLIDGNGQLHYREMGLATFSGLLLDIPTIGIAKSKLLGEISNGYVVKDGKKIGYMINSREYVSAGNKIDLETSISFVKSNFGEEYPFLLKEAHNTCTMLGKAVRR